MAPPDRTIRRIAAPLVILAIALSLVVPRSGTANGGTLRLADVPVGSYRLSVFTDPTPVRPDSLDVSVLVLHVDEPGMVDGIEVTVTSRGLEGQAGGETLRATRDQADDPRYYAAKFAPGAEGRWEIGVHLEGPDGAGGDSFEVIAREPGLLGHPVVLMLLALLPLAVFGVWLLRQERETRAPGANAPEARE